MIHILTNKKGEFYWLSIVKKGRGFEENGRSTESFTQKHNCEKSIKNEAGIFSPSPVYGLVDHTKTKVAVYTMYRQYPKWVKEKDAEIRKNDQSEIEFVQRRKKV